MVPKEGEEFVLRETRNVTLEGGMKPKSHQTREFDVLTNKYEPRARRATKREQRERQEGAAA
jgi:hypothetical protein